MKKALKTSIYIASTVLLLTGCAESIKRDKALEILNQIVTAHAENKINVNALDCELTTHDTGESSTKSEYLISLDKEFSFYYTQTGELYSKNWGYYNFQDKKFYIVNQTNIGLDGKKTTESKTYKTIDDPDNKEWAKTNPEAEVKLMVSKSATLATEMAAQLALLEVGVGITVKNETYSTEGELCLLTDLHFQTITLEKQDNYYDVLFDKGLISRANTLSKTSTLNMTGKYNKNVSISYPNLSNFTLIN